MRCTNLAVHPNTISHAKFVEEVFSRVSPRNMPCAIVRLFESCGRPRISPSLTTARWRRRGIVYASRTHKTIGGGRERSWGFFATHTVIIDASGILFSVRRGMEEAASLLGGIDFVCYLWVHREWLVMGHFERLFDLGDCSGGYCMTVSTKYIFVECLQPLASTRETNSCIKRVKMRLFFIAMIALRTEHGTYRNGLFSTWLPRLPWTRPWGSWRLSMAATGGPCFKCPLKHWSTFPQSTILVRPEIDLFLKDVGDRATSWRATGRKPHQVANRFWLFLSPSLHMTGIVAPSLSMGVTMPKKFIVQCDPSIYNNETKQ